MQPGTPTTTRRPQGNGKGNAIGLVIKLALVASLIALGISVARFFKKKPPEEAQVAEENVVEAPEVAPPVRARRPFPPRETVRTRPVQTQPPDSSPSVDRWASNVWASVEPPRRTGFLMAPRLPELSTRIDDVFKRFEPPVFYEVPLKYGTELSNQLAEIRTATNAINQFVLEYKALFVSADRDHKDYVQQAKSANSQRRVEAGAAMKKLTELQALYLERKREFQQESARLKPQLQDPPAQFETKLALYQKAVKAYETDMNQLETAIHTLQKQNQATIETLAAQDENIEKAYELSEQDVIGQLTVLSNRVERQLGEVNITIRDYNGRLELYGTPLPSQR